MPLYLFGWMRLRKYAELEISFHDMKIRMEQLEKSVNVLQEEIELFKNQEGPAMVIEHVEHLHVAKLEHSNHIGTLHIQDLSGKLNIGMNYSGPLSEDIKAAWMEKKESMQQIKLSADDRIKGPHYNIRARDTH